MRNASGTLWWTGSSSTAGDAEVDEVLQGRLVRQSRVGAAQLLRYARVASR